MSPMSLLLVEFGAVEAAEVVGPYLARRFALETKSMRVPTPEVRKKEWQLSAEDLLSDVLRLRIEHGADYALGITEDDMYIPQLNYVFGIASHGGRSAVVSTHRLRSDDPSLFRDRLVKESVHELGHAFGAGHCDDPACVMHFSNSLAETDLKHAEPCKRCLPALRPMPG